jgi:Na+/alanine symporter
MVYLEAGLASVGLPTLGKVLGVAYAVMLLGSAVGGGNMFQANQTVEALVATFDVGRDASALIAVIRPRSSRSPSRVGSGGSER